MSLRYLDTAHPTLTQRVEVAAQRARSARFVRVDIVQVTNPKEVALSFDVFFEPHEGARVWLGTFGPFPADNPGKFIIPTKGIVRAGGALVVSMVIPQGTAGAEAAAIRVAVGRITLAP